MNCYAYSLQPDVSKEYDEFNMRKRLRDESRVHVIRVVIKMLNVTDFPFRFLCRSVCPQFLKAI